MFYHDYEYAHLWYGTYIIVPLVFVSRLFLGPSDMCLFAFFASFKYECCRFSPLMSNVFSSLLLVAKLF